MKKNPENTIAKRPPLRVHIRYESCNKRRQKLYNLLTYICILFIFLCKTASVIPANMNLQRKHLFV